MSAEDYLAFERRSDARHEYHEGLVVAMAGASRDHSRITRNVIRHVANHLAQHPGCELFTNDTRVAIGAGGRCVYPDAVVVCGEARWLDDHFDTLLNPALLVEVLSPSTQERDRGEKLFAYQQIDSLQGYLIIHQERPRVEYYSRQQGSVWLYQRHEGLSAQLDLTTLSLTLPLHSLYEQVAFVGDEQDAGG
jgi:Uma2 family endonuclease